MTELAAGQTHAETNTTPPHVFLMFLHQNTQQFNNMISYAYHLTDMDLHRYIILPKKIVHLHRNPQDAAFLGGGNDKPGMPKRS